MTAGGGRFGPPEGPGRPPPAGLFTRGYDRAGTDELVDQLTARLQERTARLQTVERENRRLRAERTAQAHASRVLEVEESISVLTTAQEHADQTMAEADAYRESVADEVDRLRAEARREADEILAQAHAVSQAAAERLDAQTVELERRARQQQDVLQRQTDYLRSVRDTAGTQVLSFLNGLVDQVASEFGAADPAAVPSVRAASDGSPSVDAGRPAPAAPLGLVLPSPTGRVPGPSSARRRRREPRSLVRHLAGR